MKIFRLLNKYFEPSLIVICISLMTTLLCVQISLRLFGASIPWAEELARYLFVWAMYLSISYCIKDDRHIRIRLLIDKLPGHGATLSLIISDLVYLIFSTTIGYFSFFVIQRSLKLGQIAPALEVPIACIYGSVLVSTLLSVIRLCVSIYQRIQLIKFPPAKPCNFSVLQYRYLKAKSRTINYSTGV